MLDAGIDPGAVAFTLEGSGSPVLAGDGALVAGDVRLERPLAYQDVDAGPRFVPCNYALRPDGRVGFDVGDHDATLPIVIDPEIGYTYTFADSSKDISISGIAVDPSGAVYVAGRTRTSGAGGVLTTAAFVAKLDAAGTALEYSTTISGSAGNEEAKDIDVDSSGNAVIAGFAYSGNFPTTAGAFQSTKGSPNGTQDAFVAKLAPAGNSFVYSSFLGGSGGTTGNRITIDGAGNAYVTGFTDSSNFPTTSPAQSIFGGVRDAFLTKVNAAGSAKVYSTYLGGSQSDTGNDVAVDSSGNACVAGVTTSANFPVSAGSLQGTNGGGSDGFWARYDAAGQRTASSYLGGTGFDSANGIDVDDAGNSFLTGETASAGFPLVSPIQSTVAGDRDAFVSVLNATGTALSFSTFYGGTRYDFGSAAALDGSGVLYVVGTTESSTFPTVDAVQSTFGGGVSDAFVMRFRTGASTGRRELPPPTLESASFLGGSGRESGAAASPTGTNSVAVGTSRQKGSPGGSHDEAGVTTYIYLDLLQGPDLFVRLLNVSFHYKSPNQDGAPVLVLYIQIRSNFTCENELVPDATFGLEIPLGLAFDAAFGKDGSRVVSMPAVGQPGVVRFELNRPVTNDDDHSDGGFVFVKLSQTTPAQGVVQIDAFADTSALECSYANNAFPGTVNPRKLIDFKAGQKLLTFVPLADPAAPPIVSIYGNAVAAVPSTGGNRTTGEGTHYNVYTGAQPGVDPVPANLFASIPAGETTLDVSAAPPASYFVVTTVTDSGESAPSREVGGVLPTVTKLKVSGTKISAQGTGFANDLRIFFGDLPFEAAPKLKGGNTKLVQKGRLVTDQTLGEILATFLTPGSSVVVAFVNGNGNAVAVEYTR